MLKLPIKRRFDPPEALDANKRRPIPWSSSPPFEPPPRVVPAIQNREGSEGSSVREQAEPYRLVTAKFPIDALTAEWKDGTNRPINPAHQRRLYQAFQTQGLHRTDVSHRLRLACTKVEVEAMMNLLWRRKQVDQPWLKKDSEGSWPSFMDWKSVNAGDVELMAGNHRVQALKEYLKPVEKQELGRWWICDIYDRGVFVAYVAPSHFQVSTEIKFLQMHYRSTYLSNSVLIART